MSEEIIAIVRRFYEEIGIQGNLSIVEELVAPNFVNHNPPSPEFALGPEGVKQEFAMFRSALPDMTITIEDLIAEGDRSSPD